MTKEDILEYLNSLRKSSIEDATHRWIGSYNGRQAVFLKFFKWLHFRNEPDYRKRDIPECILGIKKLNRIEKTPYKSTDIWDAREHALFLKHCPNKRDRCFHSLAIDMSARPGEILNLKIKDIRFFVTDEGKHYAEVRINDGKTGPRTVPLIDSIPYLKEILSFSHNDLNEFDDNNIASDCSQENNIIILKRVKSVRQLKNSDKERVRLCYKEAILKGFTIIKDIQCYIASKTKIWIERTGIEYLKKSEEEENRRWYHHLAKDHFAYVGVYRKTIDEIEQCKKDSMVYNNGY